MIESYLTGKKRNKKTFFDELLTAEGTVRAHWQGMAQWFQDFGAEKTQQKTLEINRLLRENGVSYNLYGDPEEINRPWKLDPIPMVFGGEEWSFIEKGVQQRAKLLNIILRDLYGSRTLIREGLIPFELIYQHDGFIRQVDKLVQTENYLINYSVDLARGPNGGMWALQDYTDTVTGAGYALENRSAMALVFPELFAENKPADISSYFQVLKSTLNRLSYKDRPQIILLSPGPSHQAYFEHAYLSSFLGLTLAQGSDISSINQHVWLKTLNGLKQVDVVLRHVPTAFMDPLELDSKSEWGVVGLVESIRQKAVGMTNPLGTKIVENPGLLAFLPQLCKKLLGEDLLLPSAATWWCGQERELDYVIENLDKLIIQPINKRESDKVIVVSELKPAEKTDLIEKIKARPGLYVGQELVNFSTTPSFIKGELRARNAVLRCFAVADVVNQRYEVMAGGLGRSSPQKGPFVLSNQSEGLSKDIWVLGRSEHREISTAYSHTILKEQEILLPSRSGEHLFWTGRYLERSVSTIRLFRIILKSYHEANGDLSVKNDKVFATLLKGLSALTGTLPGFKDDEVLLNPEKELVQLAVDPRKVGSITYSVESFLKNAYSVRDRLGLDTWRILNQIALVKKRLRRDVNHINAAYHRLDQLIINLMAFNGLTQDNMTRDPAWRLLTIGKSLEITFRSCFFLREVLTIPLAGQEQRMLLEKVLLVSESLITYRYLYRSTIELSAVLRLLILNENNPKSLVFLVSTVAEQLRLMPDSVQLREANEPTRLIQEALSVIRVFNVDKLFRDGSASMPPKTLEDFFSEVIELLTEASQLIFENYFHPAQMKFGFVKPEKIFEGG